MKKTAYLSIGSNIGDRRGNLTAAVESLSLLCNTEVTAVSPVYETEPVGYADQSAFYNIAVKISTKLSPGALLGACLGIEAAMGRKRLFKNGPRIIDIDLIDYEDFVSSTAELTVPHPRASERAFVMVPLMALDSAKFGSVLPDSLKNQGIKKVFERLFL